MPKRTSVTVMLMIAPLLLVVRAGFAAPQSTPPAQNPAQSNQATAPTERREHGERIFGTVASVGVDRFEVKRMDGTTQTVMVDHQTKLREGGGRPRGPRAQGQQGAPGEAGKEIQLEDLKPGDHVFVGGRTNDSNQFVAAVVRRITDEEVARFQGRTFGEIQSINQNQLTVRNPMQGERTIVVNEQTTFTKDGQPITLKDLKVGDRIFATGKETNGQFVAERVMTGQFQRGGGRDEGGERQP